MRNLLNNSNKLDLNYLNYLFPTSLCGVLTFGAAPAADRPTDRTPPGSELLLAPPLSFFYTHTRHTHVDSLTHTRQTHTRSLTVPFAHGARAGASLDTHRVDAHTFAHGARARLTLDTHSALQALDGARARFGAPPLDAARRSTWAGAALQALDGARARFGAPPP